MCLQCPGIINHTIICISRTRADLCWFIDPKISRVWSCLSGTQYIVEEGTRSMRARARERVLSASINEPGNHDFIPRGSKVTLLQEGSTAGGVEALVEYRSRRISGELSLISKKPWKEQMTEPLSNTTVDRVPVTMILYTFTRMRKKRETENYVSIFWSLCVISWSCSPARTFDGQRGGPDAGVSVCYHQIWSFISHTDNIRWRRHREVHLQCELKNHCDTAAECLQVWS